MRLYLINLPGLYFHLQLEQTVSGVAKGVSWGHVPPNRHGLTSAKMGITTIMQSCII